MKLCRLLCGATLVCARLGHAQEANSGFDLRTTLSAAPFYTEQLTQSPRDGSPVSGAFQAMFYPTWKLSSHWALTGVVQLRSRPNLDRDFSTQGYGAKGDVLNLSLSYSRIRGTRAVVVRIGKLPSAFGTFYARYDPADNPVTGVPPSYGYYKPVSFEGVAGAEVEAAWGKLDARAQFANSSPANPRNVWDRDQYGNWAGGAGYTIRQGFHVGGSVYYGPYLDRKYPFYFPGEANPRDLPATGYGVDAQWGRGPWNAWGEWQRFRFDYHAIPVFTEHTGYAELRRVLTPRWYVATRAGYMRRSSFPGSQTYELGAGFRPNRSQILKATYTIQQGRAYPGTLGNVAAIQWVTSFRVVSLARD